MDQNDTKGEVKQEPKAYSSPVKFHVRTAQIQGNSIVEFRDDVVAQAMEKGRAFARGGGDVENGWWPALAPLKRDEKIKVRQDLVQELSGETKN